MKLMNVFNKQLIYLNNSLIKFMSCCRLFSSIYTCDLEKGFVLDRDKTLSSSSS